MSDLLSLVVETCKEHNITVLLTPTEEIEYPRTGAPHQGYFVENPDGTAILGCALLDPSWEQVLLHEFNHSLQWIENSPAWKAPQLTPDEQVLYGMGPGSETLEVIHNWLEHELELEPDVVIDLINRSIIVELDCEKRTNAMGAEMYDDWDAGHYIKLCNSYLRAYRYALETRVWPNNREDEKVLAVMPPDFSLDYFGPLSAAEKEAYFVTTTVEQSTN